MRMEQSVRSWIEDLPKRGRITFSMDDVRCQFPDMPKESIRSSIYRLINKRRVCSVWKNFYIVVPDEYALHGFVPPIEYVDNLMNYLGQNYYVGLLNAAALHGSSHQQPQSFMVIVSSNDIRSDMIDFVSKAQIHIGLLQRRNTSYGEIYISNPLMTALDLIMYEYRVGGLERAISVIDGLIDEIDIAGSDSAIWTAFPIPVIQRFGFIVESVLGYSEIGNAIYEKVKNVAIAFRKSYLAPKMKFIGMEKIPFDSKWKIIINSELELDI